MTHELRQGFSKHRRDVVALDVGCTEALGPTNEFCGRQQRMLASALIAESRKESLHTSMVDSFLTVLGKSRMRANKLT